MLGNPQATLTNKCLYKFGNCQDRNQWLPYFNSRASIAFLWSGNQILTY